MNCANHPDASAVAYCRTCGKPLCAQCTRDVRGVIYCEHCLAERVEGTVTPTAVPVIVNSGPNPALAGILSGLFPFGVGAVYTGQYAKGLAHLITFVLLVVGMSGGSDTLHIICSLGMAFFYVYQIIDSVRTAKALQLGQPAPDPLGLGRAFGAGEKVDTSKTPLAAIILIGLGFLFLLQTSGILDISVERLWPVFLIGLGVWLFARRLGLLSPEPGVGARSGSLVGPTVLVTIGALSLMENLHGPSWDRTWPALLLAIGLAILIDRAHPPVAMPPQNGLSGGPVQTAPPPAPTGDTEVKNG